MLINVKYIFVNIINKKNYKKKIMYTKKCMLICALDDVHYLYYRYVFTVSMKT